MKVSVIIPCFNNAAYVAEAIESALAQQYDDLEVIVIDDGSSDQSLDIIRGYDGRIVWRTGPNQGACAARNAGLALARGDYIIFLDADDFLLPAAIARQVLVSKKCTQYEFVSGRTYRLEEASGIITPHGKRDGSPDFHFSIKDLMIEVPVITAQLWPRAILHVLGGFKPKLAVRQDFDLLVRALLGGFSPVPNPSPIFCYRNHGGSGRISKTKVDHFSGQLCMYKSHYTLLQQIPLSYQRNEIALGLSGSIWITGRNALRAGHKDLAASFFKLACACDPSVRANGRLPYRALVALLGPIRAEAALSTLKQMQSSTR